MIAHFTNLHNERSIIAGYGTTEGNKEIVRRVEEVAKKRGISMAQVACAWVLTKDPVAAPVVGSTSLKNLEELVGESKGDIILWQACAYYRNCRVGAH